MSQWLLVVILALCGAGFLAFSLLRARASEICHGAPATGDAASDQEMEEIAQDLERHRTNAPESKAARPAVVTPAKHAAAHPAKPRRLDRVTALGIGAVVVAGAVGLYLATDEATPPGPTPPTLASASTAADPAQPKLPDVDTMIARVVERLKKSPDNAEDWRMLAWSYFETKHYREAVDAYSHAVSLQPNSTPFQSAYGEAQVLAAGGKVTPDALKAFAIALKGEPNDERALHFTGLAKKDKGDTKGAITDWVLALKNAKPDSLWAPRLRAEINETAKAAGIDVAAQMPPPPPVSEERFTGPAGTDVQQAQSMTPEEQQSMIRNMVAGLDDRLARNPRDRDGWMRLIRSRKVLGEADLARSALDRALQAFQDDPTTQVELKTAALQLGISPGG